MSGKILCVNIDHIATLRQARGEHEPDPVEGAMICENNGADGITVHLREDRRHIQDNDVFALRDVVRGKFNLEMALSDDIIEVASKVIPDQITLVPEKRAELTTEGGLDVSGNMSRIRDVIKVFHDLNVLVSLFIEPDIDTVSASKDAGADYIEIHTGRYCNAAAPEDITRELDKMHRAAEHACALGLRVNAGHGLKYSNVIPVLSLAGLEELNIGHSIISNAVFLGLPDAVKKMKKIILDNPHGS
ncbi:MAG TPA: pyridoxine 5'-phosphate synthase [Spirochaetota bacterium]|nr:pyridoxine 5'-phosphate synthase [Spirochaetota bacterium]HPJ36821.1 pyridoxine 5'-phosphate synthase [Spirochaetota bacterium]HPQ53315.1 pyridoxine 5'-phosphate synthase [Spirochaetota bacterium]